MKMSNIAFEELKVRLNGAIHDIVLACRELEEGQPEAAVERLGNAVSAVEDANEVIEKES